MTECPIIEEEEVPPEFTENPNTGGATAIIGGIGGALVLGGAIAGGLFMSQKKRAALLFDTTQWNNTAISNPLYHDRTLKFENPMYEDPSGEVEEDD